MESIAESTAKMIDILPENEQMFAYEFVKRLVRAWDPDFTKLTKDEARCLREAESSGFIGEEEIDWDNLKQYE